MVVAYNSTSIKICQIIQPNNYWITLKKIENKTLEKNMNLKKTAIAAALVAAVGAPTVSSADTIDMNFSGTFTLINSTNAINANTDAIVPGVFDGSSRFDGIGSSTPVSGAGSFDTATGQGTATIVPFSFFGGGAAVASSITFQAIGNGMGGPGTLVGGQMSFNWSGNTGIPVNMVFDAAGFFGSIGAVGTSWTVGEGCTGCATSTTVNTVFGAAVGAVPMAMTNSDVAGFGADATATFGPGGPAYPFGDDGIASSPMTTEPFPGQNAAFDFTTINATNVPQVPVPAAAWLFGSGLLGLVGVARRRRQS